MSRFCLVLAGILGLSMQTLDAAAPANRKNNSVDHRISGTIVAMHLKGGRHSITVRTHHRKYGQTAVAGNGYTRTFAIDQNTRVEFGSKNQLRQATLAALHKGEHVVVLARNHHADAVIIHHGKKRAG